MPPMNQNLGAPAMTKHGQIEQEEIIRLKDLYKAKVGVMPKTSMTIQEIEDALEDPEVEKIKLLAESRDEDKANIQQYHHA